MAWADFRFSTGRRRGGGDMQRLLRRLDTGDESGTEGITFEDRCYMGGDLQPFDATDPVVLRNITHRRAA